jgi:hypothetical protein
MVAGMKWLIAAALLTVASLVSSFTKHPVIATVFLLWTSSAFTGVSINWSTAPEGTTHFDPVSGKWEKWSGIGKILGVRQWNGYWELPTFATHRELQLRVERPEVQR